MTEERTWDELCEDQEILNFETETEPAVPDHTIFTLPEKSFAEIKEIESVNFYPTKAARRKDPGTRQVAMLLAVNEKTGQVPVVQPEKAGSNEWSLIQGGIDSNETARDAVLREAYEEAGIREFRVLQYVGSYKAAVPAGSEKRRQYTHQFFHCFVASIDDVSVQSNCDQVAHASLFHQDAVLKTLLETASPVKLELLPKLCQAAVGLGLLPPSACRRS